MSSNDNRKPPPIPASNSLPSDGNTYVQASVELPVVSSMHSGDLVPSVVHPVAQHSGDTSMVPVVASAEFVTSVSSAFASIPLEAVPNLSSSTDPIVVHDYNVEDAVC